MKTRNATPSDLEAMRSIYAHYVRETPYTFEYETPDAEEFAARFSKYTSGFPWLLCEEDGKTVGYAYASPAFVRPAYQWCAEVTVYLRPDARGRGYGRALYEELEQRLRAQGYRILIACITACNHGSLAFHERLGYTQSGYLPDCGWKLGSWHGVCWLQKRIGPTDAPPAPPLPPTL